MNEDVDILAKKIWDYHHLNQKLEKADAIFVLGSYDTRVAEYAAILFLEGWAPLIIFSGKEGIIAHTQKLTSELWDKSEADMFAEIAIKAGVPKENILIENQSKNTGENIIFTKGLLEEKGISIQKFIVVQKPYMERRAYATFKMRWPEKEFIVTSPPISFEEYPYEGKPKEALIGSLVGDLQRIKEYPNRGWQIPQDIPPEVWDAYEKLVAMGYTGNLIRW
jgi:uncharacterized SAM-binding protein YcdF (DUF218 family)